MISLAPSSTPKTEFPRLLVVDVHNRTFAMSTDVFRVFGEVSTPLSLRAGSAIGSPVARPAGQRRATLCASGNQAGGDSTDVNHDGARSEYGLPLRRAA